MCFFDDHVSHVQRINEANQLGIKHIIFDDNYSLEQINVDGWPPIPTVDMCFDDEKVFVYVMFVFGGSNLSSVVRKESFLFFGHFFDIFVVV